MIRYCRFDSGAPTNFPRGHSRISGMMDYYPNKTAAELLTMLSSVQAREGAGAPSMSSGIGLQTMRTWQNSPSTRMVIRNILYSLHRRDPVTYQDPYNERVRRSQPHYTGR